MFYSRFRQAGPEVKAARRMVEAYSHLADMIRIPGSDHSKALAGTYKGPVTGRKTTLKPRFGACFLALRLPARVVPPSHRGRVRELLQTCHPILQKPFSAPRRLRGRLTASLSPCCHLSRVKRIIAPLKTRAKAQKPTAKQGQPLRMQRVPMVRPRQESPQRTGPRPL